MWEAACDRWHVSSSVTWRLSSSSCPSLPSSPKLWLKVCREIKFVIIFHSTLRSRCGVSLRHVSAWDKDCQWGLGVSVQEQQRQEGSRYTINLNCSVSDNLGQTSARLEFFCKKVNLRAGDRLTLSSPTRRWAHWTTHRISGRRKRLRIRSRENLTFELNRGPSTLYITADNIIRFVCWQMFKQNKFTHIKTMLCIAMSARECCIYICYCYVTFSQSGEYFQSYEKYYES